MGAEHLYIVSTDKSVKNIDWKTGSRRWVRAEGQGAVKVGQLLSLLRIPCGLIL